MLREREREKEKEKTTASIRFACGLHDLLARLFVFMS